MSVSRIIISLASEKKTILRVEKGEEEVEHVFRRVSEQNVSFRTIDFGDEGVIVFNDTPNPIQVSLANSHILILDSDASKVAFLLSEHMGSLSRFNIEVGTSLQPFTGFLVKGSMTFLSAF